MWKGHKYESLPSKGNLSFKFEQLKSSSNKSPSVLRSFLQVNVLYRYFTTSK